MSQAITSSELTSTIGFFLTLTSLLGTFFYVHLSNWFREKLELKSKYDENSVGDDERRKQARIECRFQLKRLLNHVPPLVSVVITVFILAMLYIAFEMVSSMPSRPAIFNYYVPAFLCFLGTYLALTTYFLVYGYTVAFRLRTRMNA